MADTVIFESESDESYLKNLEALEFNYDAEVYEKSFEKQGWIIDQFRELVGKETPGEALKNGVFERVKEVVRMYHFPNPRRIHAVFDAKAELYGRNMLQVARFLGFRFRFGVRVTQVIDERKPNSAGQTEESWGYSYRTLKGHFEVGQITFVVSKNHVTGEIFFGIDAYSKPNHIPNWFYRIDFKLFGRMLQRSFVKDSFASIEKLSLNQ